jgi:hypothetical protein
MKTHSDSKLSLKIQKQRTYIYHHLKYGFITEIFFADLKIRIHGKIVVQVAYIGFSDDGSY